MEKTKKESGDVTTIKATAQLSIQCINIECKLKNSNLIGTIPIRVPVISYYDSLNKKHVNIGIAEISYDEFKEKVKNSIRRLNNKANSEDQIIEVSDQIIKTAHANLEFTSIMPGDILDIELELPKGWFKMKDGSYGFVWKGAMAPNVLVISNSPSFKTIEINPEDIGSDATKLTGVLGEFFTTPKGDNILKTNTRNIHILVKRILKNGDIPNLDLIRNNYYKLAINAQQQGNEYIVIDNFLDE